jgi:hypothetical protein
MELNAVGDFLAGVFAPIALIWLVAAVLTQRQELNETRDQFEDNRKVVDAQLKTINSQNELLALQHHQAVENAAKAYKLSLFDKRFQIYQNFVNFGEAQNRNQFRDNHSHSVSNDLSRESYSIMFNLAREAAFVFDRSTEDWLDRIAQRILDYVNFRAANPSDYDPVLGEAVIDDHYVKVREQSAEYKSWIEAQFKHDVKTEKFWRFMNVSDQPYDQTG